MWANSHLGKYNWELDESVSYQGQSSVEECIGKSLSNALKLENLEEKYSFD